jgi:ABC-type transport system involved in multi-copper enzyme maturation permease subunit
MAKSSTRHRLISWIAIKGWSWPERILVLGLGAAAVVALFWSILDEWFFLAPPLTIGAYDANWIIGGLVITTVIVINVIVFRHGGWHLLGPHFYYDVVRLARRGRSTVLRVVYIFALFVGLAIVFENSPVTRAWTPNDFAQISEKFTYTLFMIQNFAIMILTPAYLGSAIAEEKERRTLELLFTTHLNNREIIVGKLTSRLIHLFGLVLAGFPILSLIQFWGGIDMVLIAGNVLNTLLNVLSIGSICLLFSTLARTVAGAVMTSYAVILPLGFCCLASFRGFPFVLQDARMGGGGPMMVSVQHLGIICVVHLVIVVGFLSLAIAALREHEPLGAVLPPTPTRLDIDHGGRRVGIPVTPITATAVQSKPAHKKPTVEPAAVLPPPRRPTSETELENEFMIPYNLPPVSENALMWKERYVGGPPWFFTPVVLVPALPFLVTGFLVMVFWFVRSLFLSRQEFQNAIEAWTVVLRVLYYMALAAYVFGVGFRAASCVAREWQQQTIEPLLLLPIDRSEILWTKLIGALVRGWPWLALLLVNIVLGTLIGAYHPFSAVMLCVAPWALVLFIAGLGLMLSVHLQTVLRANLVMLVVVVLLIAASLMTPHGITPPLGYLEPFAFPMWGDVWGQHGSYVASAFVMLMLFTIGAVTSMRIAFALFERRSS